MPIYILEFFGQVLLSSTGWVGEQSTERSAGPLSRYWMYTGAPLVTLPPSSVIDEI
jgi:hypothetical protein